MMNGDVSRILIVKLSAIGDVIHTLPLLEVLGDKFRHAKIDWLVEEDSSQIIEGHPKLNRVIVSRRKSWQKRILERKDTLSVIREVRDFIGDLRLYDYDLVIDIQGLFKSGILVALSRGNRKIGMNDSREGARLFLNKRPVPVEKDIHAIDRYLKLAEYLGCDISTKKGLIPISERDRLSISNMLGSNGLNEKRFICINPMAKWKTKLWEPERFAILADRIQNDLSCEIIFTGGRQDRPVIKEISGMMKKASINLAGRTNLRELAFLYSRSLALITTDTGPMHIAAAMGCKVVALFGPTDPGRTGPYGMGHRIITAGVKCSPCFKKACDSMECMKGITVEKVMEGVQDILSAN
ncbi:MAG TPA: glycosyltransferase family 9 protein [Desulfobacteraceae bacterium]|nr:glycosyltransferase family 9 protein [Desulfobacteraceae bacterium]HPQ28887.1 glycosyltransferase family 9 protein [Desulfobacteraceae bacterium]